MDIKNTTNSDGNDQHKPNSSEELLHREKIDQTPFEIVGNPERGIWIAFGKYKVSKEYSYDLYKKDNENETWAEFGERILVTEQWNIIANMIVLFQEYTKLDIVNFIQSLENHKTNTQKDT